MGGLERAKVRGTRRGERAYRELGAELRETRLASGWTQQRVADVVGMSRSRYIDVEAGRAMHLTIVEASQICAVLGLDLAVRAFPGSGPIRDAAHSARLVRLTGAAQPPLRVLRECPLPGAPGRFEQRAWDALVVGAGLRTAVEMEMRVRDAQALERRLRLKRRDDPTDRFVLALADTKGNRRLLKSMPEFMADLPRLGPSRVSGPLAAGRHPPSCLVVI